MTDKLPTVRKYSNRFSSSLVSSFAVFGITGVVTLYEIIFAPNDPFIVRSNSWLFEGDNFFISFCLFGSMYANAAYFYYFVAFCEYDKLTVEGLETMSNSREWYVRIFNQTLFMGFWFAMQTGPLLFLIYLIILYISFVLWDAIAGKKLKQIHRQTLVRHDVAGLIIICLLAWGIFRPPEGFEQFLFGSIFTGYTLLAFSAISSIYKDNKFNPFRRMYWGEGSPTEG